MDKTVKAQGQRGIQSIEVGFRLIRVLETATGKLPLKTLADLAEMPASNAHLYMVSFCRVGLAVQDPITLRYGLGPYAVQVGGTRITAGSYKVAWQGTGPAVEVSFSQYGKTVVTVPGTLKTNDDLVTQDAIVTEATSPNATTLKEIDFGHQKEALVFDQNDQNPSGQ